MENRVKHLLLAIFSFVVVAMHPQQSLAVESDLVVLETSAADQIHQSETIFESDSWENPGIIYTEQKESSKVSKSSALSADIESADNLSGLKDIIYSNMSNREESFLINYTGDTSSLKSDIQDVMAEIEMQDEYLANSRSGYSWSARGYANDMDITFEVGYLHSKSDEDYIESKVDDILSGIISPDMSDLEKVKAVNDYIVLNTEYSTDTFASAHSPYAILTEGKGVCQAYALLEYKMLGKLGFEHRYVVGDAGGVGHAWNSVNLDGSWYFIDSTWNDPVPDRKHNVSYCYFLVTDDYLDDDHNWEESSYQSTGYDEYSYFHEMDHTSSDIDYIYYRRESDAGTLHKSSVDGSEDMQLTGDKAYYIANQGEWVYYSNYSYGGYVFKVKKDGTDKEQLNSVNSKDIHIDENNLVYTSCDTGLEEYIQIDSEQPGEPEEVKEKLDIDPSYVWDEPFSQKTGQPAGKVWTIEFSKPVDGSTANGQSVFVGKIEGEDLVKTDITVTLADSNKIEIKPQAAWESGGEYYLFISEGVTSGGGEALGKGIRMKFTVE